MEILFFPVFIIGVAVGWFWAKREFRTLLTQSTADKKTLENHLQQERHNNLEAEKKVSELKALQLSYQDLHTKFTEHFKNLSQEIIDSKSKQFQERAEKDLQSILNPLKDKIQHFQKSVEDKYHRSSEESNTLKGEIKQLCDTHSQLKTETRGLTHALKGSVKAQGVWGEMILNTILKHSGLVEGEHYITQGKTLGLKDEEGRLQKPDVVINLPNNRHLVIDSKVSLTHYEQFISTPTEENKQEYLSAFLTSLKAHIKQLSSKNYAASDKLASPDFTFMFFPIEGALSLALEQDKDLFEFSWKHSIAIVGPTSLLAAVRVAASVWRREKQNQSAMEIALAAGKLYDKCSAFIVDLEKIGDSLKKARNCYDDAANKLHIGQGNIVSKLEKIKQLGARSSKQISKEFISYNH